MREIKLREDGLKVCTRCKKTLPLSDFSKSARLKCGYNCWCKQCMNEVSSANERKPSYRFRRWALNTLKTHKISYEIQISLEKLILCAENTPTCLICGDELNWERGTKGKRPRHNNPTLDRINNDSILTDENVQIICHRCNTLKSDGTLMELIEYCKRVVKNND